MILPPHIHRYWTGARERPCVSAVGAHYAAAHGLVRDWDDSTLPTHIKDLIDSVDDFVPESARPRHRGNVARLALLREFGGIWIDHDVILLTVPSHVGPWVARAGGRMSTSVMGFNARDPLLTQAIDALVPAASSLESSGELMLTRVWAAAALGFHPLPFDRDGRHDPTARPWAVHTWSTG